MRYRDAKKLHNGDEVHGELLGYKYPSFRAAAEDCSLFHPGYK